MPLSLTDPFTLLLFVVASVMMVGYAVGRWVNRRRAQQISAWLEPGLRSIGGKPVAQRLSLSAFRFKAVDANRPFSTVTATVVLISREALPTWVWERLHARRDVLLWHVTWRQPPTLEAEILDPGSELGRRGEAQARRLGWAATDLPGGRRLYCPPGAAPAPLQALADELARRPLDAWRLAVRGNVPHLLLSMPLPDLAQLRSNELIGLLSRLSKVCHAGGGDANL